MIFHENGQKELFELISTKTFQIQIIDNQSKHLLKIVELITTNELILFEELLYLTWFQPVVFLSFGKNEDVVPSCLQNHLWVFEELIEELVLNFAIKFILQYLYEVNYGLN